MKAIEVTHDLFCFAVTLRVQRRDAATLVRTVVIADGMAQARALIARAYGDNALVSIVRVRDCP